MTVHDQARCRGSSATSRAVKTFNLVANGSGPWMLCQELGHMSTAWLHMFSMLELLGMMICVASLAGSACVHLMF